MCAKCITVVEWYVFFMIIFSFQVVSVVEWVFFSVHSFLRVYVALRYFLYQMLLSEEEEEEQAEKNLDDEEEEFVTFSINRYV